MKHYEIDYLKERLASGFAKFPKVLLAYLYGSQVKGKVGELSDLDIAVLWKREKVSLKDELLLQIELKKRLGEERLELVSLNNSSLSFCYQVIAQGVMIFGEEEERIRYETDLLNKYLDFSWLAEEYNRKFLKSLREK